MKDKYFGDEHDFRKYVLLKFLQEECKWSIFINWMRTTFEPAVKAGTKKQRDGNMRNLEKLSLVDPEIYTALQPSCQAEKRHVSEFKKLSILNNFNVYEEEVPDSNSGKNLAVKRQEWFNTFIKLSSSYDLIFFDPDNGIEVKSTGKGQKNSYKYLFRDEIKRVYDRGQNILIYQHRNRQSSEVQISEKLDLLKKIAPTFDIRQFPAGSSVNYFLMSRPECKFNGLDKKWNQCFAAKLS